MVYSSQECNFRQEDGGNKTINAFLVFRLRKMANKRKRHYYAILTSSNREGKKGTKLAKVTPKEERKQLSRVTLSAQPPMLPLEQRGSFIWEFKSANPKSSTVYPSASSLLPKRMRTQTAVFTHRHRPHLDSTRILVCTVSKGRCGHRAGSGAPVQLEEQKFLREPQNLIVHVCTPCLQGQSWKF